jgi:[protein-PII] uridylyltransferase
VTRVFHVADQFEGIVPAERWALVQRDLARAFLGRLALDYRLAERRARYAGSSVGDRQESSRVVVENAVSDAHTVIEVHAADRVGLLYTLASTFDDLLLEVKVAKVATQRDRVVDVFYVTDAWGRKLTDEEHLREVARALEFALDRGV